MTYTDTVFTDGFQTITGQPQSGSTYGSVHYYISLGATSATNIASNAYGTLYVSQSGACSFTPDSAAINALNYGAVDSSITIAETDNNPAGGILYLNFYVNILQSGTTESNGDDNLVVVAGVGVNIGNIQINALAGDDNITMTVPTNISMVVNTLVVVQVQTAYFLIFQRIPLSVSVYMVLLICK
ncbi:MAG: hypothetical protein QX189_09135 [Methylococcales bacterium]